MTAAELIELRDVLFDIAAWLFITLMAVAALGVALEFIKPGRRK